MNSLVEVTRENGIDREQWSREEYVEKIRFQMSSSLYTICVLFKELKEKFFKKEDDSGQTWTNFCKEKIGISRHAVAGYLRIGKYVLPNITQDLANKLGVGKLLELSKLGEDVDWEEVKSELHEEISLKAVRQIAEKYSDKEEKVAKIKPKKKSASSLKKIIENLDEDLKKYLPDADDFEGKKKFKELSNELYNSIESLTNMLTMLMKTADG